MNDSTKRFRDYGFNPGLLPTGAKNSIADVFGVRVGHATRVEGDDIRTGVTLIDPGVANLFRQKLPAAIAVGNGYGKLAGSTQVDELGTIEAPIALTNSLAVGPVLRGVVDLVIKQTPDLSALDSINAVVGEINDGRLNRLHANTIGGADVEEAYRTLSADFAMGCVGAGTGARAFSWKGGIGSSSRLVRVNGETYTVGALVLTNSGGALTMMGVPVGQALGKTDFDPFLKGPDGSCMIVIATDAPLDARELRRIASRSFLALARTGSVMAHASGDYAVAFSTNRAGLVESADACLTDADLNPFFLAAVEAAEESIYDALFLGETTSGFNGITLERLPVERVVELLSVCKNK